MKPEERVKLGIVRTFQIPAPFLKLTVLENLLVGYQNNPGEFLFTSIFKNKWLKHEKAAVEKAFNLLELLDLSHMWDNPADTLSGGQLKLLEIGKALMADPKVLLLDEPVGSINPVLAEKILHYIKDIKDKLKIAIIMTEHRLDIAFKYVDYVYGTR
jgi:branched-chain amino acid transport system ATP-binding protein